MVITFATIVSAGNVLLEGAVSGVMSSLKTMIASGRDPKPSVFFGIAQIDPSRTLINEVRVVFAIDTSRGRFQSRFHCS